MEYGLLIFLGLFAFIFGFFIVLSAIKTPSKNHGHSTDIAQKNGTPITPRHLRSTIGNAAANNSNATSTTSDHTANTASAVHNSAATNSLSNNTNTLDTKDAQADALSHLAQIATAHHQSNVEATTHPPITATPELQSTPVVSGHNFSAAVAAFDGSTSALDEHFYQQQNNYDNNYDAIGFGHKEIITIIVKPNNHFIGIDGASILELVRQYGLKYGVINTFHRYEHSDGKGDLWFSILGLDRDLGLVEFNLLTLPHMTYHGLAFFLFLSDQHALRGFDSMTQIAYDFAQKIDGSIYDSHAEYRLDHQHLQELRNYIIGYNQE